MAAAPAGEAAALLEGVVVSTTRRGKKLICQGFTYRFKHDMKGGIKGWQCDQADKNACKGTCKSRQEGDKVTVEVTSQHNHLPTPDVVTSLRMNSRMREQALSQPTATVSNLAAGSLQQLGREAVPFAPTNEVLKRAAWKSRRNDQCKKLRLAEAGPAQPEYATLTNPVLLEVKVNDEGFLLCDSGPGPKRIVLFGCKSAVDVLATCKVWLSDGTFKTAPKLFEQVYTIHGMEQGFCVPCIYALLPDKSQSTYNRLWNVVRDLTDWHAARELNLLVDFEKAAYNAFQQVFVGATVSGCYFHFKQAFQ